MTSSTATLDDHCWPVQPWAAKQLALLRLAAIESRPNRDGWCPIQKPCGRCQPNTAHAIRITDAPCRIPFSRPASQARLRVPGPATTALHQENDFTGPRRLPPTSPTVSLGFRRVWPREPPPVCPASASHPASYALSRPTHGPLDFRAPRLFAGSLEPHAPCQLLQWSVPRARQRTVQTSMSCGEPPLTERRPPFRDAADRAFSGQGSLGLLDRVDPRWKRPLAPTDLPRPNRLEHPMSRNRTRPTVKCVSIR